MASLAELARRGPLAVFFYGGVVSEEADRGRHGSAGVEAAARMAGWREREPELEELGYRVVGVSSQSSEVQALFVVDWIVSFMFLSDEELLLADQLGLPTGGGPDGERVYEPLTLLIRDGRIWWVFYPLDRPVLDAEIAIERIRSHG